jgi:hypothetical protein
MALAGGGIGVLYAYYFERDRGRAHLTLAEWSQATAVIPGVRPVAAPRDQLSDWLGYYVDPHAPSGGQFHDRIDRAHDAEVFVPESGRWLRAFYWHAGRDSGTGVVTFEGGLPPAHPVWEAARALAAHLGAELVGEDDTAYER